MPDLPPLREISQAPHAPLPGPAARNPLPLLRVQNPVPNLARNPRRPRNPTCPATRARAVLANAMAITATASLRLRRRIGAVLPRIGLRWVNLLLPHPPLPRSPVMHCLRSSVLSLISKLLRTKYLLPVIRSLLLCTLHKYPSLTFLQTHLFFTPLLLPSLLLPCQMLPGTAKLHRLVHPLSLEISIPFRLTLVR